MKSENQTPLRTIKGSRHELEREIVATLLSEFTPENDRKAKKLISRLEPKGKLKLVSPDTN